MSAPVVLLDGTATLPRDILGNKGYGINAMRREGLPVPPAFCITTEVCARYFEGPDATTDSIRDEVRDKLRWLEAETSRSFGAGPRPLLVSVRSGAALSMPGMLDTVLDLGINDAVESALAELHGHGFASDTRRRFCHMYRRIVLDDENGQVPDDPFAQLRGAIGAVFRSWNSPRAIAYRKHHGLREIGGTAVVVQAMVFGNMESKSGTGVLFSRNPMTGANEPFGEWLPGGQGEDVVSGTFDVEPVSALRDEQPAIYDELITAAGTLERIAKDIQDIEFTVEQGKLWLLQTRVAKRSAQAAVRLTLTLRDEGLIDDLDALCRIDPTQVEMLLRPSLQPETRLAARLLAKGLPACPGVVSGTAYDDVDEAIDAAEEGEDVILVRCSTSPDDIHGMMAARRHRYRDRRCDQSCGRGVARTPSSGGRRLRQRNCPGPRGQADHDRRHRRRSARRHSRADLVVGGRHLRPGASSARWRANTVRCARTPDGGYPTLDDNTEAGVRAALDAGLTDVVSPHPLITMLIAARLQANVVQG